MRRPAAPDVGRPSDPSPGASLGPNLGPTSAAWLQQLGITTLAQLRTHEPVRLYLRIRSIEPRASLNLLYGIVAAQEGLHWRDVARERRSALLMQIDALAQQARRLAAPSRDAAG